MNRTTHLRHPDHKFEVRYTITPTGQEQSRFATSEAELAVLVETTKERPHYSNVRTYPLN